MSDPEPYPPHRAVSVAEAQEADRAATAEFGIPSRVLMENAGRGLASLVLANDCKQQVIAIFCGPGNNGGDGYACGRFLLGSGAVIRVVRCAPLPPRSVDSRREHDLLAQETRIQVAQSPADEAIVAAALSGASVVVDALFGIGLRRPLEAPYPLWIELINAAPALRISADVPSGMDADTGEPLPISIRADVTAAMGFVKLGSKSPAGTASSRRIVEVDIGLPAEIHRRFLSARGPS